MNRRSISSLIHITDGKLSKLVADSEWNKEEIEITYDNTSIELPEIPSQD